MQASWSGSIVFGLVSVPVQLYKAAETHAGPKFHQVHEKDGGRIRLKRYCEAEDVEVPYSEIAKGYDTGGEELILTSKDLADLPIPSRNAIDVLAFVDEDSFDPMQYESAYYVGLGKRSPGKPYALLREAMRQAGKVAVSKVTLASRESLAILRVVDDLLVLHTMLWPDEVRPASGVEPPVEKVHANELKMARSLMDAISQDFDVNELHDEYRQAVEALIDAKLQGRSLTRPRPVPASNVVDIGEVLKRSLEAQKAKRAGASAGKRAGAKETAGKGGAGKSGAAKSTTPAKKASAPRRRAS
jgi:DNA end-binding protein Ku